MIRFKQNLKKASVLGFISSFLFVTGCGANATYQPGSTSLSAAAVNQKNRVAKISCETTGGEKIYSISAFSSIGQPPRTVLEAQRELQKVPRFIKNKTVINIYQVRGIAISPAGREYVLSDQEGRLAPRAGSWAIGFIGDKEDGTALVLIKSGPSFEQGVLTVDSAQTRLVIDDDRFAVRCNPTNG